MLILGNPYFLRKYRGYKEEKKNSLRTLLRTHQFQYVTFQSFPPAFLTEASTFTMG